MIIPPLFIIICLDPPALSLTGGRQLLETEFLQNLDVSHNSD